MSGPVLELSGIVKNYHALRPLRIERLVVHAGERVAIVGVDQPGAEVLVNLITGAMLPDRGEVVAFGRATADIGTSDHAPVKAVFDLTLPESSTSGDPELAPPPTGPRQQSLFAT